jgi:hypothetical protein
MPFRTRSHGTRLGLTALLGIAFTLFHPSTLHAQVVSDPRVAEFDPSPDHWQVLADGEPAVLRYELGVYLLGASAPFTTVDMGKPSPDADGKIRYDFSSGVGGWPLPGGEYEARVSAVGPEGEALSGPSNPFTFGTASSSCTISLSATTVSVPASGGSYTVYVTTGTGCSWIATTVLSWVTVRTSGGSGGGTVAFVVAANASTSSRTGALTIGGRTTTIRQDGLMVPAISWTTPAPITEGTPLGAMQLDATANVPGTFVYSPDAGTVLPAGTYTYTLKATFTPADKTLYATATAYTNLLIVAAPGGYQLAISRPSGGMVYSAGISCGTAGTACLVSMPASMTIGLQATPDAGYAFSGWTGDCSGTSPGYWLQLSGWKSCGATFTAVATAPATGGSSVTAPAAGGSSVITPDVGALPIGAPYTLTIVRPSGGVVKSAGIGCGTNAGACSVTMPGPMVIGLEATADPGYVFLAWTGHCSGSSPNQWLALEGPRTCGATFAAAP